MDLKQIVSGTVFALGTAYVMNTADAEQKRIMVEKSKIVPVAQAVASSSAQESKQKVKAALEQKIATAKAKGKKCKVKPLCGTSEFNKLNNGTYKCMNPAEAKKQGITECYSRHLYNVPLYQACRDDYDKSGKKIGEYRCCKVGELATALVEVVAAPGLTQKGRIRKGQSPKTPGLIIEREKTRKQFQKIGTSETPKTPEVDTPRPWSVYAFSEVMTANGDSTTVSSGVGVERRFGNHFFVGGRVGHSYRDITSRDSYSPKPTEETILLPDGTTYRKTTEATQRGTNYSRHNFLAGAMLGVQTNGSVRVKGTAGLDFRFGDNTTRTDYSKKIELLRNGRPITDPKTISQASESKGATVQVVPNIGVALCFGKGAVEGCLETKVGYTAGDGNNGFEYGGGFRLGARF